MAGRGWFRLLQPGLRPWLTKNLPIWWNLFRWRGVNAA